MQNFYASKMVYNNNMFGEREKINRRAWFISGLFAFCLVVFIVLPAFGNEQANSISPSQGQILRAKAVIRSAIPKISLAEMRRIETLISQLGSPKWKVRERATKELSHADINAIPFISAAISSNDLEIAIRAEQALKVIRGRINNEIKELSISIETLATVKDKQLIGALIELLESSVLDVRYIAEYNLRRFTGKNFGFNSYAEVSKRTEAVQRWRKWWRKNKQKFRFAKSADPSKLALLVSFGSTPTLMVISLDGEITHSWEVDRPIRSAMGLKNGNVIVGFQGGKPNVVEYDPAGRVVWDNSKVADTLGTNWVVDVAALPNGHILLDYVDDCHVSEITRQGKVIWQKCLDQPDSAERLANGNTLITQFRRGKAIEVNQQGDVVWQYTNLYKPTDACRLPNGDTVICEYGRRRILRVNRMGDILWQYPCRGVPGSVCLLPNERIVVIGSVGGIFILDGDGRLVRQLHSRGSRYGRVRLVPIAVLNTRLKGREPH